MNEEIRALLLKISGGIGCDLVTGTSEFKARLGRITAIVSNADASRLLGFKESRNRFGGAKPVVGSGCSYLSVKRKDTITLSGASGTATIVCDEETDTATFDTNLTITAANFVTANAADYLAAALILTSSGAVLTVEKTVAGTDFVGATSGANATTDLIGTPATVVVNVTADINDNKQVFPDYPLESITPAKGSFWVFYTKD